MRAGRAGFAVAAVLAVCACSKGPTTGPGTPSPPASTGQGLSVDLPIAAGDGANAAFGIWPFGVHGSSHALDGHPGFDIEFRPGASVRAAADGTILHVTADPGAPDRFTIRISHAGGAQGWATDYTNISSLAPGVTAGAIVQRGQALGAAGVQTQMIGSALVTWAMTHFQVNDFSRNDGLTNVNAVSPELNLSASGRTLFDSRWAVAAYVQELTEPLPTNSRATSFPLTRAWATSETTAVSRIEFTRTDPAASTQTYAIKSAGGATIETGTVMVVPSGAMSSIDLTPAGGGPSRLGVYDIVSDTMRMSLAAPGAPRPASLAGAVAYR